MADEPNTVPGSQGEKDWCVRLGVPGLDEVFPDGIRPGSLILITGSPGSGKTLLAMQLLKEMRLSTAGASIDSSVFLSADERERVLQEQVDSFWPGEMEPGSLSVVYVPSLKFGIPPNLPLPLTVVESGEYYEKRERRALLDTLLQTTLHTEYTTGASSVTALAFDGVLNLPELRGASLDERRDALHKTAQKLRELVFWDGKSTPKHRAAIMTAELPTAEYGSEVRHIEEYLADVVIRLTVEAPAARKRRRLLEVRKSRYMNTILGEHSLWIVSFREYRRRQAISARLGWSRRAMEVLRPGIVVFPRMRWHPGRGSGPLSANLEVALTSLRDSCSKSGPELKTARLVLQEDRSVEVLCCILRGKRLVSNELKEVGTQFERLVMGAVKKDWRWPSEVEVPAWDPEMSSNLDWSWLDSLNEPPFKLYFIKLKQASASESWKEECSQLAKDISAKVDWSERQVYAGLLGILELTALFSLDPGEQAGHCAFGVEGLDEMFGAEGEGRPPGVVRGTSTLVVGGAGSGKSTLAYCFALRGLIEDEKVVFLSFDERHERVMRQAGGLVVRSPKEGDKVSQPLSEMASREILRADLEGETNRRLVFVHENPINADLDLLVHFITREINLTKELAGGRLPPSLADAQPTRKCRLIIDSLSDLQRNIRDPLVFNDLVSTLLNKAAELRTTTLLVQEEEAERGAQIQMEGDLSSLTDNVALLRQVEVNNTARKCVTIQKTRGRGHDPSVGELVFRKGDRQGTFQVRVRKGFEGMSKVLTGQPQAANIELRLFHENERERECNLRYVEDMKRQYGERARYVPFTLKELRRAFWHREEGRDIRPDADVIVLSLDQPWVRIFTEMARYEDPLLAKWIPSDADALERSLLSQLDPRLCRHAALNGGDQIKLEPMLALPHYFDLGLLLERTDLLTNAPHSPTHWDNLAPSKGGVPQEHNEHSLETVVANLAHRLGVPGFAFNMENMETVACVFLEMCWNFFATQDFLVNDELREHNLERATDALAFLARLRWSGVLPYPCTLDHCANAIYTRAWYANVPILREKAAGDTSTFRPVPYFTSAWQFTDEGQKHRKNVLLKHVESAHDRLEERLKRVQDRLDGAGEVQSYLNHTADCIWRQQVKDDQRRINDRKDELVGKGAVRGYSCCGAWYLGVLSSGGNANLGWALVHEALDPRRIEERAFAGAGLPAMLTFYRKHFSNPVPGLVDTTFGQLEKDFFGRVRSRETALGVSVPHRIDSQAGTPDPRVVGEMPEILHGLVMTVLGDTHSRPDDADCRDFIKGQLERVFDDASRVYREKRS